MTTPISSKSTTQAPITPTHSSTTSTSKAPADDVFETPPKLHRAVSHDSFFPPAAPTPSKTQHIREDLQAVAHEVADGFSHAGHWIKETTSEAFEEVTHGAHVAADAAKSAAGTVSSSVAHAAHNFADWLLGSDDNLTASPKIPDDSKK